VITKGLAAFPDDNDMTKARVLLLVDLGLYQEAVDEGMRYLAKKKAGADEYTALAEALLKGAQYGKASLLLETARLRFSDDPDILIQLAKSYLESGHTLVGARLFEHAAQLSPKLTADAAELYRRAGHTANAMRLNAKIDDQKVKVRQRLGLLIESEHFEEAAALLPRLQRLGLLEEDAVVYGAAYALFMVGRFDEAELHLKKISDSKLFEKAVQLRRIMGTCRTTGRQCP
jgi:tetratricopeptide (TPR) repeat protein